MQSVTRYVFVKNGFLQWFRGMFQLELNSTAITPVDHPNKVFVYRNYVHEGYKIGISVADNPMDLTNNLLL
jgi:hypothetical protein